MDTTKVKRVIPNDQGLSLKNSKIPRKPAKTFIAISDDLGRCPNCDFPIVKGQRVRYRADDSIVHFAHDKPKPRPEALICDRCFLTAPCECE